MRIFLSTGEPSGDLHAANLIRAIRRRLPEAEFVGYGGPRMAEAGGRLHYPLCDLAVMWLVQVILNIHVFVRLVLRADRYFRDERPDVVVLIDYPGFNWWIARMAKKRGIPVVYFVPPQLWAWAGWRVKKMRRFVDHVLCSLPFEETWYRDRGVDGAVFIGHPYFDELAERVLDEAFLDDCRARGGPLVALLPGSRTLEIERNLPMMLRAAALVAAGRPEVRFAVAALHERHRALCVRLIDAAGLPTGLRLEVYAGRTPELIRLADMAWSVSGSVSLELMAEALPTVVIYKMGAAHLWLARKLVQVKYMCLVNLLAGDELMPEYATSVDVPDELARHALSWLGDEDERRRVSDALAELRDRVALPGATDRAAGQIAAIVRPESAGLRGPHRPQGAATGLEHAG